MRRNGEEWGGMGRNGEEWGGMARNEEGIWTRTLTFIILGLIKKLYKKDQIKLEEAFLRQC